MKKHIYSIKVVTAEGFDLTELGRDNVSHIVEVPKPKDVCTYFAFDKEGKELKVIDGACPMIITYKYLDKIKTI